MVENIFHAVILTKKALKVDLTGYKNVFLVMPAENYKKLTIAIIVVLITVVVIIAVITSEREKEKISPAGRPSGAIPSGPMTDSTLQTPMPQMESLPGDPGELVVLGDKYFDMGRYDMAVQVYEKALEKNPGDVDTYNDLGLALHYLRRSDAAIDTLRKGTQVMPSYQRIWLSLGYVLMSTGRNEEAKTALKKASEIDPATDVGREADRMLGNLR
ncbi:MAG: tetratricopeptide repeat protein [Nitrospiraceae bacterium]|nr:MAG: tetratricopeptide repeat protein [Nitrospiraceae bacterium]